MKKLFLPLSISPTKQCPTGSAKYTPFITHLNSFTKNAFRITFAPRKKLFIQTKSHIVSPRRYLCDQKTESNPQPSNTEKPFPRISEEEIKRENYRESYLPSYCCVQVTPDQTISGHVPYYMNKKMGFLKTKSGWNRYIWYKRAQMAYETCCAHSERTEFYEFLGLEPTLANWFRITLLHIWMVSARWRLEGQEVNEMPQHIVDIFFKDAEMRMVEGKVDGFVLNKMLKDGAKIYFGIMTALDEALMEGDQELTEAVWRNILHLETTSATKLYTLVEYIRREMASLDKMTTEELVLGQIRFSSLKSLLNK